MVALKPAAIPIPPATAPTTRAMPPSVPAPVPLVPPAEFDHPYQGRLIIQRFSDQKELRGQCSYSPFPFLLGCAHLASDGRSCRIVMMDDEFVAKLGYTTEQVFRHENAHCRGWPGDHPGARQS